MPDMDGYQLARQMKDQRGHGRGAGDLLHLGPTPASAPGPRPTSCNWGPVVAKTGNFDALFDIVEDILKCRRDGPLNRSPKRRHLTIWSRQPPAHRPDRSDAQLRRLKFSAGRTMSASGRQDAHPAAACKGRDDWRRRQHQ